MRIPLKSNHLLLFIISFALFFTRIISFREFSLEPDELEWLYDIRKCLIDPRPFVGFDSHTSGPFAIYLLVILKILTGFSKLYQLRIVTFFIFILPSFFLIYQISQKGVKFIGALTFVVMVSAKNFPHFGEFYDGIYSYNTEYQVLFYCAILFWILRNNKSKIKIIIYATILFFMPFVKFQAIPLMLFFGGYMSLNLIFEKKWGYLKYLITTYLVLNLVWIAFLYFYNILPEFYYSYFLKNFDYMSNFSSGEKSYNPLNFLYRISTFYYFIYIFLLIAVYHVFKADKKNTIYSLKELLNVPLIQSGLLSVVSCLSIILAKNDYGHYYILLFLPFSIFISDLVASILKVEVSPKYLYPTFIIILLANFNFDYLNKSIQFSWNKIVHHSTAQYDFGKHLQTLANEKLITWLKNQKNKNQPIIITGWTQAQAIYYVLGNDYQPAYRSSHCFYFQDSFINKKRLIFNREQEILMEDIVKYKPIYIVDTWKLIQQFKGEKITDFILKNYEYQITFDENIVYRRR